MNLSDEKGRAAARSVDPGAGWSFLSLKVPQLRNTRYLLILGFLGILLVVLGNLVGQEKPVRLPSQDAQPQAGWEGAVSASPLSSLEEAMEKRLGEILSRVEGAGQVRVKVFLAGTGETVYATNEMVRTVKTTEADAEGGTREVVEEEQSQEVVYERLDGGREKPATVQTRGAEIRGVLVVAEGAADSRVKARLTSAVQSLLDLPAYRIAVLPGRVGD